MYRYWVLRIRLWRSLWRLIYAISEITYTLREEKAWIDWMCKPMKYHNTRLHAVLKKFQEGLVGYQCNRQICYSKLGANANMSSRSHTGIPILRSLLCSKLKSVSFDLLNDHPTCAKHQLRITIRSSKLSKTYFQNSSLYDLYKNDTPVWKSYILSTVLPLPRCYERLDRISQIRLSPMHTVHSPTWMSVLFS